MAQVQIKRGDTYRKLNDTMLIGSDPVDLTNTTVKAVFKQGTVVAEQAATVVTPEAGVVQSDIPSSVASTAGIWLQEWEITYANQSKLTVPTAGYNEIVVNPDLG